MPEYLEEVPLNAFNYITLVSLYLSGRGNVWVRALKPNLEKYIAEELSSKIKILSVAKLYTTISKASIDFCIYINC